MKDIREPFSMPRERFRLRKGLRNLFLRLILGTEIAYNN